MLRYSPETRELHANKKEQKRLGRDLISFLQIKRFITEEKPFQIKRFINFLERLAMPRKSRSRSPAKPTEEKAASPACKEIKKPHDFSKKTASPVRDSKSKSPVRAASPVKDEEIEENSEEKTISSVKKDVTRTSSKSPEKKNLRS